MAREAQRTDDVFATGGAPTPVTETKEFKEAISKVKDEIIASLKGSTSTISGDAMDLFRQMALSIAEMNHQGDRRHRPVDPKVMAARAQAQEELNELLDAVRLKVKQARDAVYETEEEKEAAVRKLSPKYRAIAVCVFDDVIIQPFRRNEATKRAEPIEFYWLNEPNDALVPLNDIAKQIHKLFRKSRGARTDIEKRSFKPAWMTDAGLIIEGGTAPQRRAIESKQAPVRDADGDLDIPAILDPDAPTVQILGTKTAPAQRGYEGKTI